MIDEEFGLRVTEVVGGRGRSARLGGAPEPAAGVAALRLAAAGA